MSRSSSSKQWLHHHFKDEYVKKAQKSGYRSRAVYKLLEIQEKDQLIKPGMTVVDLGAAPGGWSQVAAELVGSKGRVIALDLLPIDPIAGVDIIQGDFSDDAVYQQLLTLIDDQPVDLVICDIAPNISGVRTVDQPRAIYLVELALDFSKTALKPGGDFLSKVFQGEGFDELLASMRQVFTKVVVRKPSASRSQSREVYLLGRGFRGILTD